MIIFTTCKINLGLNIISRRPDGYHDLSTIMIPVDWGDILEIVPASGNNTTLTVLGREVDCPIEDNLVMRAYRALDSIKPLPPVDIILEKIVPDGAGLGGGSSDASFTLTALNKMFNLGLSLDRLSTIAATLGADCPLFIHNRPMLATGTGTTLTPVDIDLSHYHILIVKPPIKISTREAYSGITPSPWPLPLECMIGPDFIATCPHNDFEDSVFPANSMLADIKQTLVENGAVYASMSGSGSAIFGLFKSEAEAIHAADASPEGCITRICHTI